MITRKKEKIGLFFGSFNPVHIGHLIVAAYMRDYSDLRQVWFIPSPQNPLKRKTTLLADHHRLMLLKTAIEDDVNFRVVDVEYKLPRPSYTINTLTYLSEMHPGKQFVLIAGTDILPTLDKWKNYTVLLEEYQFYIYNRPGYSAGEYASHPSIKFFDAPLIGISSSFIRKAIKNGKDVQYMLPPKVWKYICEMHFYEK